MVILVDSSAWIDYLRGSATAVAARLRAYHDLTSEVATTEVVVMELLAGTTREDERHRVQAIAFRSPLLRIDGLTDYVQAAALYRACRRRGETVRRMTDCIVAAVAIRHDVPVLHNDRDFEVLARHTPLQLA